MVDVVPSPKLHEYVIVSLFGSFDPALENWIPVPSLPEYGPLAFATGGKLPATVTIASSLAVPPSLSVTISVAVYVPFVVYECEMAKLVGVVELDVSVLLPSPQRISMLH